MLELKFASYHRAASLSCPASSVDACSIGWRIIDQTRLSSNTACAPTVFLHNSAILCNNYISLLSDLCACVHVKKKWHRKGNHSSSVSGSNHLVRLQTRKTAMGWCTAQWKMLLFCAKAIVKESCKFELARLKKKTFAVFSTTGGVARH